MSSPVQPTTGPSLSPGVTRVGGVPRGALAFWLASRLPSEKTLVVLPEEDDVASLADDVRALAKLPEGWSLPAAFSVAALMEDDPAARSADLSAWAFGKTPLLVVSRAGLDFTFDAPENLRRRTLPLKPGLILGRRPFEDALTAAAYSRNERCEQVGEYAIRGDVVDIWPPTYDTALRLTWNFDTIEAIRTIDMHSQRSEKFRTEATLYPVLSGTEAPLSDYFSPATAVVWFSANPDADVLPSALARAPVFQMTPDGGGEDRFESPPLFAGHTDRLREQLLAWHEEDWRVVVFCHNRGERDRLEELLIDRLSAARGVRPPWMPELVIGELEHGFVRPGFRQAVLANSEIFGRYRKRVRLPKIEGGSPLASPLDVHPGDYMVHERHGIGRYQGLRTLKVGNVSSEFLAIEYKGGDKLYVPIFEIQQVQKYLGAEGRRPALSSLDTAAWERVKAKVKEDVIKLAADLLRKAAKRSVRPGHAFPPRTHLEEEFAASFLYKLTSDQEKTLAEVEADMTAPKAMDRLICGDVGFGKTEIAMRAALKSALAGKQVLMLCPTTILAEQHARNFTERLADYPVTVRLMSRFQEKSEQVKILEAVMKGGVDILIGTHRLLSADVHVPNLGLLIIDEEHRFGVKQKTKLFSFRETVDVLSLTATPIPRTLASSLSGIKDLSVIETPPEGRLPITTHVGSFDEDVMVKAVQNELDRGGQVFYVHNRVKTLEARRAWLTSLLPSIRIGMAHGQMNETGLETVMHDFLSRNIDVLLATSIIESGLDIPSVNTLIVEDAEEMGLAQLYQLRGRVGRSRLKASCYLFYGAGMLTTDAKKRLDALKEFTALGSGFRLAMRDMEIRGAGNLLGPQQHGNMAAVGVETYSQLLNEEIQKVRGEVVEETKDGPLLEMSISAYLPDDYLPSETERVQMYKRVLAADAATLAHIKEELIDRCGPLPAPAKLLFDAAALRQIAREKGLSEVHEETESLVIYFRPTFQIPESSLKILVSAAQKEMSFIPGPPSGVRVPTIEGESGLDTLGRFLRRVFPEAS